MTLRLQSLPPVPEATVTAVQAAFPKGNLGPTCRACPVRQACTQVKDAPHPLTVRLQTHHEALQTAR
jgi:hypothetical protein